LPLTSHPDATEGIDKEDPLGTIRALTRPRFSQNIQTDFSLVMRTPFASEWLRTNIVIAKAEAWKDNISLQKNKEDGGTRLICKSNFLQDILLKACKDLLIFIKLELYKESYGSHEGSFSNSTAVLHINQQLKMTYYKGPVNKIKKNRR
jgi:hypothetical protein